jgi:precorrin-6B methylase 2
VIVVDVLVGIVLIVTVGLLIAAAAWLMLGVPSVPTPASVVRVMIDLADIKPGETVIDLGAGDGRVLIEAAKRQPSIRAIGYELNPMAWLLGRCRIILHRLPVAFHLRSFFSADLSKADVVFLYLFPETIEKLQRKLQNELRPGTRVVSYMFRFPQKEAVSTKKVNGYWGESSAYLYRV